MSEFYISIQQPPDDSFGKSLISLLSFLQELYTVGSGDNLIVNLDSISFAYPFLILPLASQINKLKEQGVNVEVKYDSSRCKEYLQIIDFPTGLNPVNEPNWKSKLETYNHKTFVPICLFPTGVGQSLERELLISTLESIISLRTNINSSFRSALSMLISETSDNIVNHAGIDFGWM